VAQPARPVGTQQVRNRNRRAAVVALAAASALLSVSACGGDGESDEEKPSSTASKSAPSPTASKDPDSAAKGEALAVYQRAWEEKVKAYAKASSKGTELQRYTSLYALRDIEQSLTSMRSANQVTRGEPALKPKVTALDSQKKIPEATVTDCVDISKWTLVDKASKKEVALPKERLLRYVSVANLEKWGNKWVVTKLTAQDRRC
jgi:hypothetical protein